MFEICKCSSPEIFDSFAVTLAILEEMQRTAAAGGARFAIMIHGHGWVAGYHGRYWEMVETLKELGYEPFVLEECEDYDQKGMMIPKDGHWNEAGHRLVAKELEEARAERDAMLANGTYALAPPAPGVGEGAEVEDLILASSDASGVGSVAGRVIVAGGMLWTSLALYAAFAIMRWIASLAAAHELRARFFAACSDPSEAALADVPYLNLRHAALPL